MHECSKHGFSTSFIIVTGTRFSLSFGSSGQMVQQALNGAPFQLLLLADASHAAIIEQPDTIVHRLDRFVRERGVF